MREVVKGYGETREELLRELEAEKRRSTAEGIFFFQAVAERSGMNLTDLQCINILTSPVRLPPGSWRRRCGSRREPSPA